ncbi:MAG: hypothetical protein RR702_07115, partial [Clostridia bacterium]
NNNNNNNTNNNINNNNSQADQTFVTNVVEEKVVNKPYRDTELAWTQEKINAEALNIKFSTFAPEITAVKEAYVLENGDKTEVTNVKPGDVFTYSVKISNNGNLAANNVVVKDNISDKLEILNVSLKAETKENKLEWKIEKIAPNETVEILINVKVLKSLNGEIINNVAYISGDNINNNETNKVENVVKYPHMVSKKSSDKENQNVTKGNKITYKISVLNDGLLDGSTVVKDYIPEGTKLCGDIVVNENKETEKSISEEALKNGVQINVASAKTSEITFTVEVLDIENLAKITNVATVDNRETNVVKNTYVEAIISATKSVKHKGNVSFGDALTYTITIINDGDLKDEVTLKDVIPEGTVLVGNVDVREENGSRKITGEELAKGTKLTVEKRSITQVVFTTRVEDMEDGSKII